MSSLNNNSMIPTGTEPPTTPSRVTGALAGAVVGSFLPLGPLTTIGGAIAGAVLGPRSGIINNVSDKAMKQLGKWAGR